MTSFSQNGGDEMEWRLFLSEFRRYSGKMMVIVREESASKSHQNILARSDASENDKISDFFGVLWSCQNGSRSDHPKTWVDLVKFL